MNINQLTDPDRATLTKLVEKNGLRPVLNALADMVQTHIDGKGKGRLLYGHVKHEKSLVWETIDKGDLLNVKATLLGNMKKITITSITPNWAIALADAVRSADGETTIFVDTTAKVALAHRAAERMGKVVKVEVGQEVVNAADVAQLLMATAMSGQENLHAIGAIRTCFEDALTQSGFEPKWAFQKNLQGAIEEMEKNGYITRSTAGALSRQAPAIFDRLAAPSDHDINAALLAVVF